MSTKIMDLNRFDINAPGVDLGDNLRAMLKRRNATFGAGSVLFYNRPILVASAKGAWMTDSDGNRYLDLYNNVPCVGHSNEHVAAAMARQAATLSTNTRYLYETIHSYAERLLATFPAPLTNVTFTCTGSESNDLALQIAAANTGGTGIIVTENAYHGNTTAVLAASPSSYKGKLVPANVRTVPAPESFRSQDPDPGATFAAKVEAAIADMKKHGIQFSALLFDSMFTSDGILPGPVGFLRPAVEIARRYGGIVIVDEVQPGFGRTGKGYWNFARHGIIPDLVTLGKPMGNGFPLGGVITRPDLLATFNRDTAYFNTFGGNALAGAVGLAVLEELESKHLIENADRVGTYIREQLTALAVQYPQVGDVRGAGLFIGAEFRHPGTRDPDAAIVTRLVNRLKEHGVLIGATGPFANTMRVRPSLCLSFADADYFLAQLKISLSEVVV